MRGLLGEQCSHWSSVCSRASRLILTTAFQVPVWQTVALQTNVLKYTWLSHLQGEASSEARCKVMLCLRKDS